MRYAGMRAVLALDYLGDGHYAEVGQVGYLKPTAITRRAVDVTHRRSPSLWRQYARGLKSSGKLTFMLLTDVVLVTQGTTQGILADLERNGVTYANWRVTTPGDYRWEWRGFVVAATNSMLLDDAWTTAVEVAISGKAYMYDPLTGLATEAGEGLATEMKELLYA